MADSPKYNGIEFRHRYVYPELWLLEQIADLNKRGLLNWKKMKSVVEGTLLVTKKTPSTTETEEQQGVRPEFKVKLPKFHNEYKV